VGFQAYIQEKIAPGLHKRKPRKESAQAQSFCPAFIKITALRPFYYMYIGY
jgi:hypothetical protein